MRRRLLARNKFIAVGMALSSLFASGIVSAGQSHSKEKFTSKEGGFSVKMPGEPKQSSEAIDSKNGPTTLHTFTVEESDGKVFYMVGYSDYQTKLDEASSLEGVISVQVESIKGKITSDKKVISNGHPGRSVTIEDEQIVFYSSVYIAGNRLYQVMYGKPKGETLSADAREFLDSFEILV